MIASPVLLAWATGLESASSISPRVDALFRGLLVAGSGMAALLLVANLTLLIRYRAGSRAQRGPVNLPVNLIEAGWIAATTVVFVAFFAWGASVYLDMERPPAGGVRIEIVARQWMWDVRHANGRRELDTLHVPAGETVRLELSSEDVIHSLFVPAFRVKQDVVPGKVVTTWFEATRPGRYRLYCSQYCGTKHAGMTGEVVVLPPAEYAAWLGRGDASGEIAARGRAALVRNGCTGCHSPGGTVRAPVLEGLHGRRIPLADGSFVLVDTAYLRDSILEPNRQVAAGFDPVMPSFKGIIPEGELLDIIAYLRVANEGTKP
ncbi:MAG TPA: cupredoxin domain-containing protein [Lacunisphaera sp.]|nr:cupredoxin domain-containing protein [Lacunisphaera sp.]